MQVQEQTQEPRLKVYTLLKSAKSPASIWRRVGGQRIRVEEKPISHAFGKVTFFDRRMNKNRTIRFKLNCDSIDLQTQMKEFNIPANEKVTQAERDALKFRYGVLATDNPLVQNFLESSPEFDKNWVVDPKTKKRPIECNSVKRPKFTLYDEELELKNEDDMFVKRVQAAKVIADIKELDEAQELMIKLNGSYFEAPDTLLKCRKGLIEYLDAADEPMLEKILEKKGDITQDDQMRIMIGKAINLKIISFDAVEGKVVELVATGKHKALKDISSEHDAGTRLDLFVEFLNSEDGKTLKEYLNKKVKKADK